MHDAASLRDIHDRGQRSLEALLRHCAQLSPEEFDRRILGFGYPSVRLQLDHMIGAEEYWLSVIEGRYTDVDESAPPLAPEALEAHRRQVAAATDGYLRRASETEINTAREMWTWPGRTRSLVPALILLRTVAHIYQHQGQVLAMCRLLGKPGPGGLDFPID
ncbi:MAG: DinB family protein [Candidatus Eisenbacteria bacterium]|uniref:DinB family protein n=1 Tax=Eiseniibacteriota bacterium TaxID=2212470 RepID=A0A937X8W2_UNCEI|nr:DinB family protein [Candidatus Eisenbacteria bacterium]